MSAITSLHLKPFKSYIDAKLPLEALTIIIGRNASGKSNALDALEVLSRLARGFEVRDVLDGRVDGMGPVRGGSVGAPPAGSEDHKFEIEIEIDDEELGELRYLVAIGVEPQPRIVEERLIQTPTRGKTKVLIDSVPQLDEYRWDIDARIHSGTRGRDPRYTYSSAQSICFQVTQRLEQTSAAKRLVVAAARSVQRAMLGIFHLDPVPSLMRDYVPEKDTELRRDASNISAVLNEIARRGSRGDAFSSSTIDRITQAINALPEHKISGLEFVRTSLGDVMATLAEDFLGDPEEVPARQMSDGMLRMLAITTAVLAGGASLALSRSAMDGDESPTIVIEELENGLHPTQARNLLQLLLEREGSERLIITTHSPALLDVLPGKLHAGVLVMSRDPEDGTSSADRLVDLPGYQRALATDSLGGLVSSGRLADAYQKPNSNSRALSEILGEL